MEPWVKRLGSRAGSTAWSDDLPLSEELPSRLVIDATDLRVAHPMFLLRLRVFLEWHAAQGRDLKLVGPSDPRAVAQLVGLDVVGDLRVDHDLGRRASDRELAVVPLARIRDHAHIEEIATDALELLEYRLTDVARLGRACHMALSELCGNAVDHGRNPLGTFVLGQRFADRRRVVVAIADLGVGIPEHLRQRYPEWDDDAFAIGQALEYGITGTGNPHRGNGLPETLDAALTSSLHAARLDVYSARGFLMTEIVPGTKKMTPFATPAYKKGTWISYELVSV